MGLLEDRERLKQKFSGDIVYQVRGKRWNTEQVS